MRFRTVGTSCDAEYMPGYQDDPCGDEITLYGGATFADVDKEAKREGWVIVRAKGKPAMTQEYLCPRHAKLATKEQDARTN